MVALRFPKVFDLRADPFEQAEESGAWEKWRIEHAFVFVPAQAFVGQHLMTYRDYPPRQKVGSFSLAQVLEKLQQPQGGAK